MEKHVDDFDFFLDKLNILFRHVFITQEQIAFLEEKKTSLLNGEVIVTGDFSENYSFVLQDAAQGVHWNNSQATVHPFVCYFKGDQPEIQHLSYVVISDCLTHDTVAVHTFQKHLVDFLKAKIGHVAKIYYFSDGAASQYKNKKNFLNTCMHLKDFGVEAEWHFFATSHGKGPCDGVGGTVKRLASRASLQRPYEDQIMTPLHLFNWAEANLESISFKYITSEEVEEKRGTLKTRFQHLRPIPGTQRLHAFIPVSENAITVKPFSLAADGEVIKMIIVDAELLEFDEMRGFVTAYYENHWWLAYVLEKNEQLKQLRVRFLHPCGPATSFVYPQREDELVINHSDVISVVSPSSETGRTYKLSAEETVRTNAIFQKRIFT